MNHYLSNMDEIKSLYIIVEGQTDARILHTLLNCACYKKVYHIPAGGFANLSSMATTIRLMQAPKEAANKIVVAFDADSEKKDVIEDRLDTMRYLTSADFDKRIGVFCFVPDIERSLFPSEKFSGNVNVKPLLPVRFRHNGCSGSRFSALPAPEGCPTSSRQARREYSPPDTTRIARMQKQQHEKSASHGFCFADYPPRRKQICNSFSPIHS